MEKKVKAYIEKYRILDDVDSAVLAVSGGPDSMALAHFMLANYPSLTYTVAHLDHGLRAESQGEYRFVADWAKRCGLEFAGRKVDIDAMAKARKQGIEETGREERYRLFRSLHRDVILTAHHSGDQAETVLANVIRGCGLNGIGGMAPREGDLTRPFLCIKKEDILAYCDQYAIDYCVDVSNAEDETYRRNHIRHHLMPLLATYNPRIEEALSRLADQAREEESLIREYVNGRYKTLASHSAGRIYLPSEALQKEPLAVARRLIRLAASDCGGALPDFEMTGKILGLKTGKRIYYDTLMVRNEGVVFSFGNVETETNPQLDVMITPGLRLELEANGLSIEVREPHQGEQGCVGKGHPGKCFVDPKDDLTLRYWRTGDYLTLENGGKKKLSDYFIDVKIPAHLRHRIPVLCHDQEVFWIVGFRFSATVKKSGKYMLTVSQKNFGE